MAKKVIEDSKVAIDYVNVDKKKGKDQDQVEMTVGWSCDGIGFGQFIVSGNQLHEDKDAFTEANLSNIHIDSETLGPDFIKAVMEALADYLIKHAELIN